jgi:hypothetical protein
MVQPLPYALHQRLRRLAEERAIVAHHHVRETPLARVACGAGIPHRRAAGHAPLSAGGEQRIDEGRVLRMARRLTGGQRQVARADKRGVDAVDREDLAGIAQGRCVFQLHSPEDLFTIGHVVGRRLQPPLARTRRDAQATRACGAEAQGVAHDARLGHVAHARHEHAVGAAVQNALHDGAA